MEKTIKEAEGSSASDGIFVVFKLDENSFALPVNLVERIILAVHIIPVPGTPANIAGIINMQGRPIPVFSLRKIFGFPERDMQLSDKIIIACISEHTISFVVDTVTGVIQRDKQQKVPARQILPGLEKIIDGMAVWDDGIILIYDPVKIFTLKNLGKLNFEAFRYGMETIRENGKKTREKISQKNIQELNKTIVKSRAGKDRGGKTVQGI